jgi:hypothetical protein
MALEYHRTAFRLLRCEPVVSKRAVRGMDSLERALGVRLPASIREWYALEGAVEWLSLPDYPMGFHPLGIAQNAKGLRRAAPRPQYHWAVGEYPSGVCYLAPFPDDPDPLVRCWETDGSAVDDADEWCERPFSAFVFACCWHKLKDGATTISGVERSFDPPQLDMLMESFDAGPHVLRGDAPRERTHPITKRAWMPPRFQFFFFGPEGLIHLRSLDDPRLSTTEVGWELSDTDESAVQALAFKLKRRGIIT